VNGADQIEIEMKRYRNKNDVQRAVQQWRRKVEQAVAGERALHELYRSFIQRALEINNREETHKLLQEVWMKRHEVPAAVTHVYKILKTRNLLAPQQPS
jgi:hypothetical protein